MPCHSPDQVLERTAVSPTFALQMNKTISAQAALVLNGGRSAWSPQMVTAPFAKPAIGEMDKKIG